MADAAYTQEEMEAHPELRNSHRVFTNAQARQEARKEQNAEGQDSDSKTGGRYDDGRGDHQPLSLQNTPGQKPGVFRVLRESVRERNDKEKTASTGETEIAIGSNPNSENPSDNTKPGVTVQDGVTSGPDRLSGEMIS